MLDHQADEELLKLAAEDLPGVGWSMREKLKALGITTVADVRNSRLTTLQHELGTKSGTLVRRQPMSACCCPCALKGRSAHLRV